MPNNSVTICLYIISIGMYEKKDEARRLRLFESLSCIHVSVTDDRGDPSHHPTTVVYGEEEGLLLDPRLGV